jgi:Spx/MgsR family transcriptional regulator
MATITMYGIKNCDTIKKARRFLDSHNVDYQFHDYRADGVDKKLLQSLIKSHGWETVVNKRGTTWRKLDDSVKSKASDSNAADLLVEHPAMIKRPVLIAGNKTLIGFSEDEYSEVLGI